MSQFLGVDLLNSSGVSAFAAASGTVAPVVARIRRSTNQAIPTGTGWTDLVWDTSAHQANGVFWTSGANIVIPETGYYQVFLEATFDGTGLLGAATASIEILLNGTTVIGDDEKQVIINGKAAMWVMAQRYFTAGDTLKGQVKHTDSASVNVLSQGDHSPDIILTKINGAKGDAGTFTKGTTTINFGNFPGLNETSVNITGQTGILNTHTPEVKFKIAASSNKTENDHKYASEFISLTCGEPTNGVGFTIFARSLHKIQGIYNIQWSY